MLDFTVCWIGSDRRKKLLGSCNYYKKIMNLSSFWLCNCIIRSFVPSALYHTYFIYGCGDTLFANAAHCVMLRVIDWYQEQQTTDITVQFVLLGHGQLDNDSPFQLPIPKLNLGLCILFPSA